MSLVGDTGTMSTPLVFPTAFDGVEDYAGTSGATVPYGDTASASGIYLPADTGFAGFKGTVTLPMDVATTIWTSYSTCGGLTRSGLHTDAGPQRVRMESAKAPIAMRSGLSGEAGDDRPDGPRAACSAPRVRGAAAAEIGRAHV